LLSPITSPESCRWWIGARVPHQRASTHDLDLRIRIRRYRLIELQESYGEGKLPDVPAPEQHSPSLLVVHPLTLPVSLLLGYLPWFIRKPTLKGAERASKNRRVAHKHIVNRSVLCEPGKSIKQNAGPPGSTSPLLPLDTKDGPSKLPAFFA
jgi:hypothetical protein